MVGPLPGRAASGKTFRANVLILLKIKEGGKIQRVDEYYSATLDEGVTISYCTRIRPVAKLQPIGNVTSILVSWHD